MRGLSSILTLVMLLLIVVSMIVFFYFWSGTMFSAVKIPTLSLVNQTMSGMGGDFKIDSVSNITNEITIYVRNVGGNYIDLNDLIIYIDENKMGYNCE